MTDQEFFQLAVREFGIPAKTAEFLMRYVSRRPHTHTTDQIEDLEPAITEIVEDVLAEEVDEEWLPEYVRLKPEDKARMVEIAMQVWRALDDKPMLDGWLALMVNIKRLGGVMLEVATDDELKSRLREFLAYIDEWIIACRGEIPIENLAERANWWQEQKLISPRRSADMKQVTWSAPARFSPTMGGMEGSTR